MIEFISISLRNFMSYGNIPTIVQLNDCGTILVRGEDLDNTEHGFGGNGVGKSSIIQGVTYALYDKVTTDISKDDLVNNINKKNLEVDLVFKKDTHVYNIRRCRKMKNGSDGNFTELLKDGVDITPAGSSNINDEIVKIIGIPFDLFVRVVTFTTRQRSFLSLPSRSTSGPNQTDLIEELFQLKQLSQKADNLKELIKDNEQKLKIEKDKFDILTSEYTRLQTQLSTMVDKSNSWKNSTQTNIDILEELLKINGTVNFDEEYEKLSSKNNINDSLKKITSLISSKISTINDTKSMISSNSVKINNWEQNKQVQISELTSKLQKYDGFNLEVLEAQRILLNEKDNSLKTLNELKTTSKNNTLKYEELVQLKSQKSLELQHLIDKKCPYCLQNYAEANDKKEQCRIDILHVDKEINLLSERITKHKSAIEIEQDYTLDIDNHLMFKTSSELEKHANIFSSLKDELQKVCVSINPYVSIDISQYENKVNALEEELLILSEEATALNIAVCDIICKYDNVEDLLEQKNLITNTLTKINELKNSKDPYEDTMHELKNTIHEIGEPNSEKIDELINVVDHQKFLYKLLTKKDSFVRKSLINKNIPFLNRQLSKYLSELGLPHTVEFTQEMTAKISQFGRELSFGNLSGGQEARVNIALSLAFRDVLQCMHDTINICMFDEVLDVGLDSVGVNLAAKLLKKKAKEENLALFIISHRDEINTSFDKRMTVQYTKGFSYITISSSIS